MDGNLSRYSEIGWVIDENVSEINKYVLEGERNKDKESRITCFLLFCV